MPERIDLADLRAGLQTQRSGRVDLTDLRKKVQPTVEEGESGLGLQERTAVKAFGPDLQSAKEWLERQPGQEGKPTGFSLDPFGIIPTGKTGQYDVTPHGGGLAVRPKGSTGAYRPVDPDTGFFSKDFLGDVLDLGPEIATMLVPGSTALKVGGAMAGGEAARRGIGSMYGFKQDLGEAAVESGKAGLWGAGATKALQLAGKGLAGVAKEAGTKNPLKWPYLADRAAERKIKDTLDTISGHKAQLAEEEAGKVAEKATKEAGRKSALEDVLKAQEEREAARQAEAATRQAKTVRSTEEAADLGMESVKATEYGKEASRLRREAAGMKEAIRKLEDDAPEVPALKAELEQVLSKASEATEKALETRSRAGLFRQTQRERAAKEARQGMKAPAVEPPHWGAPPSAPSEPSGPAAPSGPSIPIAPAADLPPLGYEKEVHGIYSKARKTAYDLNKEAAAQRFESAQLAAQRIIPWPLRQQIAEGVSEAAHKGTQQAYDDAYRQVVAIAEKQGMSREAAVKFAGEEINNAQVRAAMEAPAGAPQALPKLAEYLRGPATEGVEDLVERAGREGAEQALGTVRAFVPIGPAGAAWRVTGRAATGGVAFAGHLIEKSPEAITRLAAKATSPSIRAILLKVVAAGRVGGPMAFKRALKAALKIAPLATWMAQQEGA